MGAEQGLKGMEGMTRPRQPEPLPVALQRRRLYVLPTQSGVFWAFLLVAIVVGALNYSSNAALALGLVLTASALMGLVLAHQRLVGLEVLTVEAHAGHAGGSICLRVLLRAPSRREGVCLDLGGESAPVRFDANGQGLAELYVPVGQRGVFRLPRLRLSTRQPLGVAMAWGWFWPDLTVHIWPSLETGAPALPLSLSGRQEQNPPRERGQEDVRTLREHRPHDGVRHMAWKASARRGRLLVREYDAPSGSTTAVLDFDRLVGLDREARLSRLATWASEAERGGRTTELRVLGQVLGPSSGRAHRDACLNVLAEVSP